MLALSGCQSHHQPLATPSPQQDVGENCRNMSEEARGWRYRQGHGLPIAVTGKIDPTLNNLTIYCQLMLLIPDSGTGKQRGKKQMLEHFSPFTGLGVRLSFLTLFLPPHSCTDGVLCPFVHICSLRCCNVAGLDSSILASAP